MEQLPFPVFGSSVHISLTPSNTMLQWRSNAFTLPKSFLLFLRISWRTIDFQFKYKLFHLQLIKTWVLFLTESVRTLRGPVKKKCKQTLLSKKFKPVENSSCSLASRSSGVMSALLAILVGDTLCNQISSFACFEGYWVLTIYLHGRFILTSSEDEVPTLPTLTQQCVKT